MSGMNHEPASAYAVAAEREDQRLIERIAYIRRRQDAGEITVRQAADERIAAMEEHLAAIRQLRERHFGGGQ